MGVRVLIADGSGLSREIIRHHLECMGCSVVAEAHTIEQAIDLFRTIRPEVMILDMGLGGASDLDLAAVIRMIRSESPSTTVLLVNGTRSADRDPQFLGEGALEFVMEPFDHLGFEQMWRSLSARYPELGHYAAARTQAPRVSVGRSPRC